MVDQRGEWKELVDEAASVSSLAVELSAMSEQELPGLLAYLEHAPLLPFRYISVHAPSKYRLASEDELVGDLAGLPRWIDAIVVHPDTIIEPDRWNALGRRLILENMDARKPDARTTDELAAYFERLPAAGLCFDIAHAKSVDASMELGVEILRRFGDRLRHVHLSSLDGDCHHVELSPDDEELFTPLLQRCRDVPWILEAPPPP
jgi:hypothetical protein